VDFLLVLIELFSLGVTAEGLRVNISSKSAISLQRGPVDPKFQCRLPELCLLGFKAYIVRSQSHFGQIPPDLRTLISLLYIFAEFIILSRGHVSRAKFQDLVTDDFGMRIRMNE